LTSSTASCVNRSAADGALILLKPQPSDFTPTPLSISARQFQQRCQKKPSSVQARLTKQEITRVPTQKKKKLGMHAFGNQPTSFSSRPAQPFTR